MRSVSCAMQLERWKMTIKEDFDSDEHKAEVRATLIDSIEDYRESEDFKISPHNEICSWWYYSDNTLRVMSSSKKGDYRLSERRRNIETLTTPENPT